jgi:hypothetical protein
MTYLNDITVDNLALTAFGDVRNAELSPIFQLSFEYTVDNTELVTNAVANGGTVTQANAMAVMGTSTTTASTALMQSTPTAKYRAGLGGLLRFTTLFTTGVAATEQYAGLADEVGSSAAFKNGYMIGFDGDTFGFHRFQNDSKTSITQANWDDPLDGTGPSEMTLDSTQLNAWEIRFQYLGAGAIELYIESQTTGKFVLVHTIHYTNQNTTPSVHNPNFSSTFWVNNAATSSNLILKTASVGYFIEGKSSAIELQRPQFSTGKRSKNSVTTEVAIFTIRNKSTYASKTNFIEIQLELLETSIEASSANNLGSIRYVKNATLGGTPSYSDIDTTDSIVEIDTSGTTVTGGKELVLIPLAGKNDKAVTGLVTYDIRLRPGDTVTVAGLSANSATINASTLWKELF